MGTDFVKTVDMQTEIPSSVNSGDAGLKYVYESIAKKKRLTFLPGEKIRYHALNSKKVKLTTHMHLSTSDCVIMTNRRLLTIEDTIEFFNLVLETRLSRAEKRDLLAFLYTL